MEEWEIAARAIIRWESFKPGRSDPGSQKMLAELIDRVVAVKKTEIWDWVGRLNKEKTDQVEYDAEAQIEELEAEIKRIREDKGEAVLDRLVKATANVVVGCHENKDNS
jgi:hypothetical protein